MGWAARERGATRRRRGRSAGGGPSSGGWCWHLRRKRPWIASFRRATLGSAPPTLASRLRGRVSTRMYASSMRVLVAPDKFRGTLSAEQAARAIETGWLRARPTDELEIVPMADGGGGKLEALVAALDGELVPARVAGPPGGPVDAAYGPAGGAAGVGRAR